MFAEEFNNLSEQALKDDLEHARWQLKNHRELIAEHERLVAKSLEWINDIKLLANEHGIDLR